MRIAAIIPARGGSKRIPHKNIVGFCGKPMIFWTIEAAIKAGIFNDIYISTDDEAIAKECSIYPVEIIKRRTCNDDHSTVQQATIATLEQISDERDKEYDVVIQLMANCPLRDWADIVESWEHYKKKRRTFQLSCTEYGFTNPWWAVKEHENPKPIFPKALKMRSQDLEKLYCPTGAIWIANVQELMECGTFYGPGYSMFPLEFIHSLDIDDYNDLRLAEAIKRGDEVGDSNINSR
jgi:N-acylneuraminate cytidylyltransferase